MSDTVRPEHDDCVPVEQYEAMRKRREQALGEALRERRELVSIVRDLAIDTEYWSVSCPWMCSGEADGTGHDTGCPWRRLHAWVSAHPVSGTETTDG